MEHFGLIGVKNIQIRKWKIWRLSINFSMFRKTN
jgi:hypothetical protein